MHTLNLRSFLWFTTGVALTVTSIATFGTWRADAATTAGESTFVPVTPCRLFDTRPGTDNVGTRVGPVNRTPFVARVTGTNGNCTIPSDATAVSMNLTAVNPTASSFVQVYPADITRPAFGSNLNVTAGQAPVPNKVDVKLSDTGRIAIFNNSGTVDVLADIVGYYTSTTVSQLSADVAALQATVTQQQAAIKSLLDDTNVIPSGVTVTGIGSYARTRATNTPIDSVIVRLPAQASSDLTNVKIASGIFGQAEDPSCTELSWCQPRQPGRSASTSTGRRSSRPSPTTATSSRQRENSSWPSNMTQQPVLTPSAGSPTRGRTPPRDLTQIATIELLDVLS